MAKASVQTKERILELAAKCFAKSGYAGTSVQDIVTTSGLSKPALYWHFGSKAGVYCALVNRASSERLRIMQEAAACSETLPNQLTEVCVAVFRFTRRHRELMRLAYAAPFAAPGEVPPEAHCFERGWQSFLFLQDLMEQGRRQGALDQRLTSRALAMGFAGLMHLHVLLHLLQPSQPLDRPTAEVVVDLFLSGAAARARQQRAANDPGSFRRRSCAHTP